MGLGIHTPPAKRPAQCVGGALAAVRERASIHGVPALLERARKGRRDLGRAERSLERIRREQNRRRLPAASRSVGRSHHREHHRHEAPVSAASRQVEPEGLQPPGPRSGRSPVAGGVGSKAMAAYMREHRIDPALVLCSSAIRAMQTLDGVAPGLGGSPEVRIESELYEASAAGCSGACSESAMPCHR